MNLNIRGYGVRAVACASKGCERTAARSADIHAQTQTERQLRHRCTQHGTAINRDTNPWVPMGGGEDDVRRRGGNYEASLQELGSMADKLASGPQAMMKPSKQASKAASSSVGRERQRRWRLYSSNGRRPLALMVRTTDGYQQAGKGQRGGKWQVLVVAARRPLARQASEHSLPNLAALAVGLRVLLRACVRPSVHPRVRPWPCVPCPLFLILASFPGGSRITEFVL